MKNPDELINELDKLINNLDELTTNLVRMKVLSDIDDFEKSLLISEAERLVRDE